VPTGAGDPRPVVLNLHGGGGNAESHRRWTRMGAAADRRGFVAVYPNGTGATSGRLLVWNAGTCCGRAPAQGVDDVGFLLADARSLAERVAIDRTRVYAPTPRTASPPSAPIAGAMAVRAVRAVTRDAP